MLKKKDSEHVKRDQTFWRGKFSSNNNNNKSQNAT